jgi:hypothetical protein
MNVDLVERQQGLRSGAEDVSRRLTGGGDVGVCGRDRTDARIGPELACLHGEVDGLKQLRGEYVGIERRKPPGFLRSQFLLGAIEAEGNDFQVAIVRQRNLHGLIHREDLGRNRRLFCHGGEAGKTHRQ